ncbi:MAG: hypothetical protein EZS28_016805, partial [Streblomastix strix]
SASKIRNESRLGLIASSKPIIMSEIFDLKALEREARQKFEAEKSQGAGGQLDAGLMGIDVMEDDYEYYESQAARQDRMNSRAKTFDTEDVDTRIREALGQAMQYYGQILTQR